ncbi:MAG: PQQ-dependent sugar dehydrogenase [Chromatiaceae bacterium]
MTRNRLLLTSLSLALVVADWAAAADDSLRSTAVQLPVAGEVQEARIPQGYGLEMLTDRLDRPRMLTFGPNGDLFIGSRGGKVYRLSPPYRDPQVLVDTGDYPHSVAFRDGEILIARTDGLYRAPYRLGQKRLDPGELRLLAPLPGGGGHSSRTVRIGPNGRVYVSLGVAGNCSDQYLSDAYRFDDRRGGIMVLDENGSRSAWEPFSTGLRNPVGYDWQPHTGVLYASNNGPDHWGFGLPPEYFSRIEHGSFHGMPWFQFDGKAIRRDDCIDRPPPRPRSDVQIPAVTFPSRSAPMAVAFVPRGAMDPSLEGDAVVALHGSWATQPFGSAGGDPTTRRPPKLVVVRFAGGKPRDVKDLVTGFQLADGQRWARPAGVAFGPDGALYFTSDSAANALFRLRHTDR